MSKEAKFWSLVGVKPHQKFKVRNKYRTSETIYFFDHFMNIHAVNGPGTLTLYDLLINREQIIKQWDMTEDERLALKYLKKCGYEWVGKNKDGTITAFNVQPVKCEDKWTGFTSWTGAKTLNVEIALAFLSWEDEYAYKIEVE